MLTGAASGRLEISSARSASDSAVAAGWSGTYKPKKPPATALFGSSRIGASRITTIECSCCRRRPGSSPTRPTGASPARVASPWNCFGVSGVRAAIAKGANQTPGKAAVGSLILPRGHHHTMLRVLQRCVIEILAYVKFIEAYCAIGCECYVLRVGQVDLLRCRARVLEAHVPEPHGFAFARVSVRTYLMPSHEPIPIRAPLVGSV